MIHKPSSINYKLAIPATVDGQCITLIGHHRLQHDATADTPGEVWFLGLGANPPLPFIISLPFSLAVEVGYLHYSLSLAFPSRPLSPPFP